MTNVYQNIKSIIDGGKKGLPVEFSKEQTNNQTNTVTLDLSLAKEEKGTSTGKEKNTDILDGVRRKDQILDGTRREKGEILDGARRENNNLTKEEVVVDNKIYAAAAPEKTVKEGVLTKDKTELTQENVIDFATSFVGNKYVYGGTNLETGVDCSGFTMEVYKTFGIELPHSSTAQSKLGTKVDSLDDALPGDLICYSKHVAIYMGDGQIVHAANSKKGIVTEPVEYGGDGKVIAIRRLFEE